MYKIIHNIFLFVLKAIYISIALIITLLSVVVFVSMFPILLLITIATEDDYRVMKQYNNEFIDEFKKWISYIWSVL